MSHQRPTGEPMSPLEHFLTTLFAVWIGVMLAGGCLFFVGRAWVLGEISQAAEDFKKAKAESPADQKLSERLKKATDQLEADQKKRDEAFKKIGEKN